MGMNPKGGGDRTCENGHVVNVSGQPELPGFKMLIKGQPTNGVAALEVIDPSTVPLRGARQSGMGVELGWRDYTNSRKHT